MQTLGWTLLAVPCVALAAVSLAPQVATPGFLARYQAPNEPQDLSDQAVWRQKLASKDLSARENDFDALVTRAAQSDAARANLETWSRDESALEFAWTCRLALREAKARAARVDPMRSMEDPFEQLRQRMFGSHSGADPFGDFLLLDPFARGGQGLLDPFSSMPTGQDGSGIHAESEGFSMESGPDGVKVHVKKNVNGEMRDEEYSAKSIEELLAAHPELSSHIGGAGTGLQFGFQGLHAGGLAPGEPRTDILGVTVPAEPESGSTGLRIKSVVPGTLAAELGLKPGQVLVSINGRAIKTRDDISGALRDRTAAAALEVEVRDAEGKLTTKNWTPASPSRGAGRLLDPHALDGSRKL